MTLDTLGLSPAGAWLALAIILGLAELAAPGLFLVFVALAAAITGVILLALPELPLAGQVVSFAVWSAVAVVVGRRWYHDNPVDSDDALLNDRGGRMHGERVVVVEAIENGRGRVRVGDSVWLARGKDAAVGECLSVIAVDGSVLLVDQPAPLALREGP